VCSYCFDSGLCPSAATIIVMMFEVDSAKFVIKLSVRLIFYLPEEFVHLAVGLSY
jgi:hypothetical protein